MIRPYETGCGNRVDLHCTGVKTVLPTPGGGTIDSARTSVFAVSACGSSDAATFSTLRTNVSGATDAPLQLAKAFINDKP